MKKGKISQFLKDYKLLLDVYVSSTLHIIINLFIENLPYFIIIPKQHLKYSSDSETDWRTYPRNSAKNRTDGHGISAHPSTGTSTGTNF